jgi:hypothetical protein
MRDPKSILTSVALAVSLVFTTAVWAADKDSGDNGPPPSLLRPRTTRAWGGL